MSTTLQSLVNHISASESEHSEIRRFINMYIDRLLIDTVLCSIHAPARVQR